MNSQIAMSEGLKLIEAGFCLVAPLNGKRPTAENWPSKAISKPNEFQKVMLENRSANYGIFTGSSKWGALLVLDIDVRNGKPGRASLEKLKSKGFQIPETRVHQTYSGGDHHIYFVDSPVLSGSNLFQNELGLPANASTGIDIKSGNAQIVGPGSTIDGKYYRAIRECEPVRCPEWILNKATNIKDGGSRERLFERILALLPSGIGEGERNDGLASIAGHLLSRKVAPGIVRELLHSLNSTHVTPPLIVDEVDSIFLSIKRRDDAKYAKKVGGK